MVKLKKWIDVWTMIERYQIAGWVEEPDAILVPEAEFERLLASVKNKAYIKNLKK